jgi:hypothetical protein
MTLKRALLVLAVATTFLGGYGAAAKAYPAGGIHGRGEYNGYFTNADDTIGTYVLRQRYQGGSEAMPNTINSATEFINFIKYTKLDIDGNDYQTSTQEKTGAAFIIHTMIGSSTSQRSRPPTAAQIAEWESRIRYLEGLNRITWRTNYTFSVNSYYQGTGSGSNPNDDAFYDERNTQAVILFRNAANQVVYAIKWECANPVGTGNLGPVPDPPNFSMSGRTTVNNASPLPGSTIQFRHYVRNNGPGATSPASITWLTQNMPSQATTAGPTSSGTYTAGQEKNVYNENVTIPANTAPGTQICRRVGYTPTNGTGGVNGRGGTVCATVRYDFTLTPIINFTVNGGAPTGSIAEQGDSITFTYSVRNSGQTVSQSANCNIYGLSRTGSYSTPNPSDNTSDGGYVPPPTGCPRTFPGNGTTTQIATETITADTANRTICRALWLSPATQSGGTADDEVCVRIVAKPYLKVYGGDVLAGGGLETAPNTCSSNTNAAITSWNKHDTTTYAGAGVQFAAFALGSITDFASGRGNTTGVNTPSWLSFANTTSVNHSSGLYGGNFGSAPCIKDYYAQMPADTDGVLANVSSMGSGAYFGSGSVTLNGGNINPGERISVYIDGDLRINGNITYTPNWNFNNVPLFQVVVLGNIYIAPGVTQLDGVYIAQREGSSGGNILTCANNGTSTTTANGAFYNACNNKLTINGAFIAHSVQFGRTSGSLSQSTPGESSAGSVAGEVFNFNPALWIAQPLESTGGLDTYDAITSLPPVL